MRLTLTGLHVYPVKSCRGIAVDSAELGPRGLLRDREWMVVRPDGSFVTQREFPRMALVGVRVSPSADWLDLDAPDRPQLSISLRHAGAPGLPGAVAEAGVGSLREVEIWRHRCLALDEGDVAATWWTEFLGEPVRMVRFHPDHRRPSSADWTEGVEALNAFSDGYPMLLVSEESLEDLNRRIGGPGPGLSMDRFRPNLVVRGGGPGAEDKVRDLRRVGGLHLRLVKPCARCRITTTDQATAAVGVEPLRTLATYRRGDARVGGVVFGQNTIAVAGVGQWLKVGDVFEADPGTGVPGPAGG